MITGLFWLCTGMIFYTYFGYPALLFLLAKLHHRPEPYPPATPAVTLLVLAYNEEAVIARKLENSLELDYPKERLQILVVTDGSDDGTNRIVRQYADRGIELTHDPARRGKLAAIARAVPLARGEIVAFSDANNLYEPNALYKLIEPFADPAVGGTTGAKLIVKGDGNLGESEGLYWRYESFIRTQETRLGCCTGVNGEMLAIRRDLFKAPPAHIINDDFYTALQLIGRGYRVIYTPEARSYERVSLQAQDEAERRARIVAMRYQLLAMAHKLLSLNRPLVVWQIVSHKFLRPLVPLGMIGAFVTNLLLVAWPPPAGGTFPFHLNPAVSRLFLGAQILFYGIAFLGNRVEHHGVIGKLLYLPTFLVNSNVAALSGLYRFFTGRHSALWKRLPRRETRE